MRTTTRQAITHRMACCVGWVLVGGLVAGCSSSAARDGSTTSLAASQPTSSASRSAGTSRTVHDGDLVVSGTAPVTRLRQVAHEAHTAVDRVRKVWGSSVLTGPVHIEVPTDEAGFRARGGSVEPGAQIAATTTAAGVVVLAPTLFTEVTEQGLVVVLTHELTHVALHQAGDTGLARWVVEGAAEFTAYRPTGLTLARLTPQLTAAVRAGRPPAGPPSDERFRSAPQAAYQEAYAWCDFLVDRFGVHRFAGFVRSADTGGSAEFTAAFGVSSASLRRPFQQFLGAQVAAKNTSSVAGG